MAAAEAQPGNEDVSPCQDGDSGSGCARTSAASGHADNSCEDGGSCCAAGGVECTHGSTCNSNSSIRNAARTECEESSGEEVCPTNGGDTQGNCPSAESGCKNKPQEENHANSNEIRGINDSGRQGTYGQSHHVTDKGPNTEGRQEDRAHPTVAVVTPSDKETAETRETQSVNGSQDAGSSPAAGTGGAPAADGQTESNVVS
ncbi:uncharacterized protein TM35_000621130, partial [Trypanosoma theileri]